MNWLILDGEKFEIIKPFKYFGPDFRSRLSKVWSSFHYHTMTIKTPRHSNFKHLKNMNFKDIPIYRNSKFNKAEFTFISSQTLSEFKDWKTVKIVVLNLNIENLSESVCRDLKLQHIFEL